MFNIFKKLDSPENCYLIASNVFEKKDLVEDNLNLYTDFLKKSDVPDYFKFLIKNFLLPYKISFLKYKLNTNCLNF